MTQRLPRASLCITILQDEDYFTLMRSPGGVEAFGVFVAMVVVARERLQQNKAVQVEGTHAIRLLNSIPHLAAMAHTGEEALTKAIATLGAVAGKTNSEPWMSVDDHGSLVIRSFFKFNTSSGWGGPRDSPSKPPKTKGSKASRKQDESKTEQLAPNLGATCAVSGSGSGSGLSKRERDAGAKLEAKTASTVVDDDDPVPVDLDGPIGPNTAKQVRETIWTADQLWPAMDNTVRIVARQWLADHPAKRIIAAMNTAKANGIGKPEPYIRSLLADPTFPRETTGRRTAPPRPAAPELKPWVPPVLPDSMFDLTPEEEAILARKGKTA